MARLAACLLLFATAPGCLRVAFDLCDDVPPHPECSDAGIDAATRDAGRLPDAVPPSEDAGASVATDGPTDAAAGLDGSPEASLDDGNVDGGTVADG